MTPDGTEHRHRLGRYELLRRLAVGGMAELHVARVLGPPGFEKTVVVKQILPAFSDTPSFVDMFLDEARLAAQLHHPNIVQVLDVGRDGDRWYLVMEYLRGRDLRAVLRALHQNNRVMPLGHAVSITLGMCAGLHHAHQLLDEEGRDRGIVHRDVSPQNVVVTFEGSVKIVDFGIAKANHRRTETNHGELKGKVRYMSPEQCRGEPLDRRTDVFAVAAVLWELTVGQRLFDGRTDYDVIKAVTDGKIRSPSEVVPGYPLGLERIVLRGLAFDRHARFATTEEMGQALAAFAGAHGLSSTPLQLGDFLRSLFGDDLETSPLSLRDGSSVREPSPSPLQPLPNAHSVPTAVSVSQTLPRRARSWLLAGAALATFGLLGWAPWRHTPTPPAKPSASTPAAPVIRPKPPVTAPVPPPPPPVATVAPQPPERATPIHRHHSHKRSVRKPLSDNLDALME